MIYILIAVTILLFLVAAVYNKMNQYHGTYGGYMPDVEWLIVYGVALVISLVIWLCYFIFN